jgi:hypothetical protein
LARYGQNKAEPPNTINVASVLRAVLMPGSPSKGPKTLSLKTITTAAKYPDKSLILLIGAP